MNNIELGEVRPMMERRIQQLEQELINTVHENGLEIAELKGDKRILEQDNKEMLEAMHFPYMSTENDEFVLVRLEYIQKLAALIARMEGKG